MTPSPMPPFAPKLLAVGIVAVLMLGIAATWLSRRNDGADLRAVGESVRVVAGDDGKFARKAAAPVASPLASREADPAVALRTLIASSFPRLNNVETRCVERACDIKATANVPEGGDDLVDYEKMIRVDIPAILRQHTYSLTEAPQVEDVADGSVRIILHTSGG